MISLLTKALLTTLMASLFWSSAHTADTSLTPQQAFDLVMKKGVTHDANNCHYPAAIADDGRINGSRFFKLDTFDRKDVETNWENGFKLCERIGKKVGHAWRLARVESLSTFRFISMFMEEQVNRTQYGNGSSWKDTWLWLDAKYDYRSKLYFNSAKEIFKFNSVFLYRSTRPVGIGTHVIHNLTYNHSFALNTHHDQCLTLALPWPNRVEQKPNYGKFFGHQAAFDERACVAVQKFKPLCESLDPKCNKVLPDSDKERNFNYFCSEGYAQKQYVDEGIWIFAKRRFLVNLKPRNKKEAEAFCEAHHTVLYTPRKGDDCLIPYLKLWNQRLTHLHFWTKLHGYYDGKTKNTNMTYDNGSVFELFTMGTAVVTNLTYDEPHDEETGRGRYPAIDLPSGPTCITANWFYEYPNETACLNCTWNGLTFALANCLFYMGTICQEKNFDDDKQKCDWETEWTQNYEIGINKTAVIEFGFKGSGYYRSTYKQQFDQHICAPPGVSWDKEHTLSNVPYWNVPKWKVDKGLVHYYDFLEEYWVLDHRVPEDDWFIHNGSYVNKCWVSRARKNAKATKPTDNYFERAELRQVNCMEWHHYICGPEVLIYDDTPRMAFIDL